MECFWGVTLPTVGRFSLYKRHLSVRIMADAQPRTSCRTIFKQLEILLVPHLYILSLMSFIVNNHKILEKIHLYTKLIQGRSINFIDQMPGYFVFKKVHFKLATIFSTVYHLV
jgi:hypothetical protein